MTANELYEKLVKLIIEGYGDADVVIADEDYGGAWRYANGAYVSEIENDYAVITII